MVLGAGQDISPSGGSHEGCISRRLLCCSGHPSLTGIFRFSGTPKCPGGSCSPALAPRPPSPEIPPALVTPIDLQCSSRLFPPTASQRIQVVEAADAKSLSPDGPISTHLFSEAAGSRWSDHGRVPSRAHGWGRAHRELSEAQGSVCPPTQNHRAAGVEAEEWKGQGRVGRKWGRQGGGGQVCH